MMGTCKQCGECCKVIVMMAGAVNNDFQWMEGRNAKKKGPFMFLPSVCKYLTKENKCSLQQIGKPGYCKLYPKNLGPQPWMKAMGCKYFE